MLKEFLKTLRLNEQKISMLLGAVVVVIVGVLIYNYFTGINRQPEVAQSTEEQPLVKIHKVAKGESLWQISLKYYNNGYKWAEIAKDNNLVNPDLIEVGQELIVPELEETPMTISTSEYLVVKGDNLWKIAVRAYADGYQWVKIWEANKANIPNPDLIEVGTKLVLPR
ncbi:MAG: LysM peptidoglycan-binding domain-containing protein [Candidatus Beckwithbacteria bacterium]